MGPPAEIDTSVTQSTTMKQFVLVLVTIAASASSFAVTCESLQAEVEAKIKAAGVAQFTLSLMDADAATSGKVVGTCGLGKKKLVYAKGSTASVPPSSAVPVAAPSSARSSRKAAVLTECRDGSVSASGECKK